MEIKEILKKYNTDKESHHHYGNAYNDIFESFNKEDKLNILEIGTQKGGSLLAWKEYFSNSKVTGLDIIDVLLPEYRLDTVNHIISDVKDYRTEENFDIVIDDGSHYLGDIVFVISNYFNKLNNNGVIVIEDVRNPELLFSIITELINDSWLAFPNLPKALFTVRNYDNRRINAETSFIISISKKVL